jgi:hypothetical protein
MVTVILPELGFHLRTSSSGKLGDFSMYHQFPELLILIEKIPRFGYKSV